MGIQELEWERAWKAASRIELVLYCDVKSESSSSSPSNGCLGLSVFVLCIGCKVPKEKCRRYCRCRIESDYTSIRAHFSLLFFCFSLRLAGVTLDSSQHERKTNERCERINGGWCVAIYIFLIAICCSSFWTWWCRFRWSCFPLFCCCCWFWFLCRNQSESWTLKCVFGWLWMCAARVSVCVWMWAWMRSISLDVIHDGDVHSLCLPVFFHFVLFNHAVYRIAIRSAA